MYHVFDVLKYRSHSFSDVKLRMFQFCLRLINIANQVCILDFYSKTNFMQKFLKFILFWNNPLHVSHGPSVHHQEFKTVRIPITVCTVLNS